MEILNKYKPYKPTFVIDRSEYWDYVLTQQGSGDATVNFDGALTDDCLSAFIDFSSDETFSVCGIESANEYHWQEAVNDGLELENIGFTGFDNGLLWFDIDRITDEEYYKMLVGSVYSVESGDTVLKLHSVTGSTKQFVYDIVKKSGFIRLLGGFYQGFFEADGQNYKILPNTVGEEWNLEFTLRPDDYEVRSHTLNEAYPANKGIFFYMGARAEDKFAELYGVDLSKYPDRFTEPHDDEYFPDGYLETDDPSGTVPTPSESGSTFDLSGTTIYDSNGMPVGSMRYKTFNTDNKYLFFNRTQEGFTVDTWNENYKIVYNYELSADSDKNLYLLVNRTSSGFTTDTIDRIKDADYTAVLSGYTNKPYKPKEKYDLLGDVIGNAFALKINDDMSVGYRYLELDCDSENGYKISEERSLPNIVKKGEWNVVNVKIKPTYGIDECGNPLGERKLRLYFYVNGFLKLVSKEIGDFNFKALGDNETRQEGVAYNISLGGGTQGLAESVWTNYKKLFPKILPLEQNFAGTFIGDMLNFRFYTCPLSFNQIRNNYYYEQKRLSQ